MTHFPSPASFPYRLRWGEDLGERRQRPNPSPEKKRPLRMQRPFSFNTRRFSAREPSLPRDPSPDTACDAPEALA